MLVGQSIGPFLIEKELGSGAMGTVFRARYVGADRRLLKELGSDPRVALKVIAFGLAGNETALARFEREAKILKQLRHPNIVRLLATGRWRETPFFAMEYIDGQSLDRVMARRDRFSWEEIVRFGQQLCSALQHAHEKGIIHRDLKPSNLMLTSDGTLKLTDFGIAKDVDVTALTGANNTIGTAAYMSPEQCKGEKSLTAKSDLYSLGVVFYELLTGKKPFQAESAVDMFMLHVSGSFTRPSQLVPTIPIWLDTLVCQLLEKEPVYRPRDAETVAVALENVTERVTALRSAGEEVAKARVIDRVHLTAPPDESDREASRAIKAGARKKRLRKKKVPIYRKNWFLAASVLAFLGAVGGFVYLVTRPESPEALVQAIEKQTDPAVRQRLIQSYLTAHGNLTDEKTEWVRSLERAAKVQVRESQLLNRFHKSLLKKSPEAGEDPEAYRQTMAALDAEEDGDLAGAAERWKALAEKYQGQRDADLALWGWVAAKKIDDLTRYATRENQVYKTLGDARVDETEPRAENDAEQKALEAIRLEQFSDFTKARERWKRLKEELDRDLEKRFWFLMAARHERELASKDTPQAADRPALIKSKLGEADRLGRTNDRVLRRDARNLCRDVRDLYKDDVDAVRAYIPSAEKLLAQLANSN